MTPFGEKLRAMRGARGVSQKDMAAALGVSAAYLSSLEHGRRGRPTWAFIQKVIGYFNIIWDDAEELQRLARSYPPRVVVDTAGLSPQATRLANLLAARIGDLDPAAVTRMIEAIEMSGSREEGSR